MMVTHVRVTGGVLAAETLALDRVKDGRFVGFVQHCPGHIPQQRIAPTSSSGRRETG